MVSMVKKRRQEKTKRTKQNLWKGIPLTMLCLVILFTWLMFKKMGTDASLDAILRFTPDNPWLAVLVIFCFFAMKSLTVVIPLSLLYLASGLLFSPSVAVLISIIGVCITISLPYGIGYLFGKDMIKRIQVRYPAAKKIDQFQNENRFFTCFFVRIIGCLPGDLLSMYFGACRIPYWICIAAGVTGSLLSIVTTTLLGVELHDPFSLEFLLVLIARILVTVGSVWLSIRLKKKENFT